MDLSVNYISVPSKMRPQMECSHLFVILYFGTKQSAFCAPECKIN